QGGEEVLGPGDERRQFGVLLVGRLQVAQLVLEPDPPARDPALILEARRVDLHEERQRPVRPGLTEHMIHVVELEHDRLLPLCGAPCSLSALSRRANRQQRGPPAKPAERGPCPCPGGPGCQPAAGGGDSAADVRTSRPPGPGPRAGGLVRGALPPGVLAILLKK